MPEDITGDTTVAACAAYAHECLNGVLLIKTCRILRLQRGQSLELALRALGVATVATTVALCPAFVRVD